jgi:hypothetical protein
MLGLADRFGVLTWSSTSSDDDIDDNGESGTSLMVQGADDSFLGDVE